MSRYLSIVNNYYKKQVKINNNSINNYNYLKEIRNDQWRLLIMYF